MAAEARAQGTDSFPNTDWGNSLRLVKNLPDWRYSPDQKTWFQWNGLRWVSDQSGLFTHLACGLGDWIRREAWAQAEGKARDRLVAWAVESESSGRINSAIRLAQVHPDVVLDMAGMDADPFQLNVLNGTVHLRLLSDPETILDPWLPDRTELMEAAHTPRLFAHSQTDHLTHLAPFGVDMEEPPLWMDFLEKVTDGNAAMQDYLQRAVGYSLSGDTSEKCVFILYGPPDTGKSTFLDTIKTMMGDYASRMSTDTLLAGRSGQSGATAAYDLARLAGVRLVTASEPGGRSSFADGLIKDITGNETITARHPYGRPFNFRPQFKLWISSNAKPAIHDASGAIWRRIKLIPFLHQFPRTVRASTVEKQLLAEMPGILGWAVRGFGMWSKHGLGTPQAVIDATAEYQFEMSPIAQFLDECIEVVPYGKEKCRAVYAAYCAWTDEQGERPVTATRFGIAVRAVGIQKSRTSSDRYYEGVRLLRE